MDVGGVIAMNVRAIRAARNERQADVAARAGMARTTLSMIESEQRTASLDQIIRLCRGLDVHLRQLLAGADQEIIDLLLG